MKRGPAMTGGGDSAKMVVYFELGKTVLVDEDQVKDE